MKNSLWALLSLMLLIATCGTASASRDSATRLLETNYNAVEQLLDALPSRVLDKQQPIVVATVVNVDDLHGSRFGRLLSEQIGTKMSKSGYSVVELKLRGNIFVKEGEGELLLSREVKDLTASHSAQAVVVGTYTESGGGFYPGSGGYVFVTLKIVAVQDNVVLAAHDYILPMDGNIRSLLHPIIY